MSLEVVIGKRERCDVDLNKILDKSQRLAKEGEDGGGCMFVADTQYTEVGVDPLAGTQRSSSPLPKSGPGPDFAWSAESTGTGAAAYANPDSEDEEDEQEISLLNVNGYLFIALNSEIEPRVYSVNNHHMKLYNTYLDILEADSTGVVLIAYKVILQMRLNRNTSLVGASACRIVIPFIDEGVLKRANVNDAIDLRDLIYKVFYNGGDGTVRLAKILGCKRPSCFYGNLGYQLICDVASRNGICRRIDLVTAISVAKNEKELNDSIVSNDCFLNYLNGKEFVFLTLLSGLGLVISGIGLW
jgi:hypothetical protein